MKLYIYERTPKQKMPKWQKVTFSIVALYIYGMFFIPIFDAIFYGEIFIAVFTTMIVAAMTAAFFSYLYSISNSYKVYRFL